MVCRKAASSNPAGFCPSLRARGRRVVAESGCDEHASVRENCRTMGGTRGHHAPGSAPCVGSRVVELGARMRGGLNSAREARVRRTGGWPRSGQCEAPSAKREPGGRPTPARRQPRRGNAQIKRSRASRMDEKLQMELTRVNSLGWPDLVPCDPPRAKPQHTQVGETSSRHHESWPAEPRNMEATRGNARGYSSLLPCWARNQGGVGFRVARTPAWVL